MKTKQLFRNKWIEIITGCTDLEFRYCRYMKNYGDYNGYENDQLIIGIPFIKFYITLPWSTAFKFNQEDTWYYDGCKSYGFDICNIENENAFPNEIFIYFGYKTRIYDLPWRLEFYKKIVYDTNNNAFIQYADPKRNMKMTNQIISLIEDFNTEYNFTHSYKYIRKNGQVQQTIAIFHKEEREWRRKWLMWIPLFNFKKKVIEIQFKDEIGENVGSWKGGCVGCDYEMLPNEQPIHTLERMERERKFN